MQWDYYMDILELINNWPKYQKFLIHFLFLVLYKYYNQPNA